MLKIFFSMLLMLFSFIMLFLSHPLSMGFMILIQTLLTCLMTGMLINTYWFSYILFLTFLGGLLVLFIYVSSIASNNLFKFSMYYFMMISMLMLLMILISIFIYNNLNWMNFSFNSEMNNFISNYLFFNNENKMNLTKLYNEQTFILMMMLIIYLFITLIAVIKITNINFGPLRMSL